MRGLVELEVRVKGPNSDLHSGIYGGAIYNPLHALSEILASLHNSDGSVNVPGFMKASQNSGMGASGIKKVSSRA